MAPLLKCWSPRHRGKLLILEGNMSNGLDSSMVYTYWSSTLPRANLPSALTICFAVFHRWLPNMPRLFVCRRSNESALYGSEFPRSQNTLCTIWNSTQDHSPAGFPYLHIAKSMTFEMLFTFPWEHSICLKINPLHILWCPKWVCWPITHLSVWDKTNRTWKLAFCTTDECHETPGTIHE